MWKTELSCTSCKLTRLIMKAFSELNKDDNVPSDEPSHLDNWGNNHIHSEQCEIDWDYKGDKNIVMSILQRMFMTLRWLQCLLQLILNDNYLHRNNDSISEEKDSIFEEY